MFEMRLRAFPRQYIIPIDCILVAQEVVIKEVDIAEHNFCKY